MAKKKISFFRSIRGKLLMFFLAVGVISSGAIGVISIFQSQNAIENEAIAKLSVAAELKTQSVEAFMDSRYGEIHLLTGLTVFQEVMEYVLEDIVIYNIQPSSDITKVWRDLETVSYAYRVDLEQFLDKYVEALHAYNEMKVVAVYDIKNADGEVVFHEGDQIYSVNQLTGNRADLSMYKGAMELMENKKDGVTAEETGCPFLYTSTIEHCSELDMASIHMAHGIPFHGLSMDEQTNNTPVNERFSSMLIVDVNVHALDILLQESTGMGESGESYLVGNVEGKEGYWMLSQSRFSTENTVFTQPMNTEDVLRVMEDKVTERGSEICQNNIYQDYRDINVLGHNHYFEVGEYGWGLMTEIDEAEVFQASTEMMMFIIFIILGLIVLIAVVALLIANMFAKPIIKVADYAAEIGIGNFDVNIDTKLLKMKDELGTLSGSFDKMIESLQYKGNMVEEVAKGNLTIDVKLASDKDMLGTSLVQMTDSLNSLLGNVNMSVDQVNIGADQVSQASQSLSQGATESASSLEEISASVTQINSQSRQNAENATEANGLAKQATEDAQKGNKEMEGLSVAMGKINTSSDQIKKIVKVIDDIAFQTNLLALNANVEAARAGKYGKGFAVVADEVRNLAVRSAEAVKETTEMVDESIRNIDSGNKAVEATATQLESIMGGSSKVADFLEEIATASNEQAEAIDQITQGLEQIDQVTQSNTASAEESAAAAEELASQSVQLKNMVATFKLKDSQTETVVQQTRQLEYQAPRATSQILHSANHTNETGVKSVDPAAVISLDDDDFDRF